MATLLNFEAIPTSPHAELYKNKFRNPLFSTSRREPHRLNGRRPFNHEQLAIPAHEAESARRFLSPDSVRTTVNFPQNTPDTFQARLIANDLHEQAVNNIFAESMALVAALSD